MSYDPKNPGPVLDTYDPDWKARIDAAERMLGILTARADPRRDHALRSQLTKELINAFETQFQYVWQLDASLREHYSLVPLPGDPPGLRIPSPPHDASPAEMQAHYARWCERLEDRRFVASLPPAAEWGTGVFAKTLPVGVTREIQPAIIERPRMAAPVRMHLVIERHSETTHVCAIQGPKCGASVTNYLSTVAAWGAERHLPRPGLLERLGRSGPRLVFHHTTAPARLGPPQQLVWAYALRWTRKGVRTCKLETQEATPYLREQSLHLIPGLGSDVAAA